MPPEPGFAKPLLLPDKPLSTEEAFLWFHTHLNVSRETFLQMVAYHDLLLKWQKRINLIGDETVKDIWRRHFIDAAQIIRYIPFASEALGDIKNDAKKIADLGCGGGFPGVVVSLIMRKPIILMESDARKIAFLKELARVTQAPVTTYHGRIEKNEYGKMDLLLSRACDSIASLLRLASQNVSRETICLFHKGKNYAMELEEAANYWQFDVTLYPSVTAASGVIVQLSHLAEKEAAWQTKANAKPTVRLSVKTKAKMPPSAS